MGKDRSYKWSWHPDRPFDGQRFVLPPDGQLSTLECAAALGLASDADVRTLIKAGALPAYREGSRWRVRPKDIANLRERPQRLRLYCQDPPAGHSCDITVRHSPRKAAVFRERYALDTSSTGVRYSWCVRVERPDGAGWVVRGTTLGVGRDGSWRPASGQEIARYRAGAKTPDPAAAVGAPRGRPAPTAARRGLPPAITLADRNTYFGTGRRGGWIVRLAAAGAGIHMLVGRAPRSARAIPADQSNVGQVQRGDAVVVVDDRHIVAVGVVTGPVHHRADGGQLWAAEVSVEPLEEPLLNKRLERAVLPKPPFPDIATVVSETCFPVPMAALIRLVHRALRVSGDPALSAALTRWENEDAP